MENSSDFLHPLSLKEVPLKRSEPFDPFSRGVEYLFLMGDDKFILPSLLDIEVLKNSEPVPGPPLNIRESYFAISDGEEIKLVLSFSVENSLEGSIGIHSFELVNEYIDIKMGAYVRNFEWASYLNKMEKGSESAD